MKWEAVGEKQQKKVDSPLGKSGKPDVRKPHSHMSASLGTSAPQCVCVCECVKGRKRGVSWCPSQMLLIPATPQRQGLQRIRKDNWDEHIRPAGQIWYAITGEPVPFILYVGGIWLSWRNSQAAGKFCELYMLFYHVRHQVYKRRRCLNKTLRFIWTLFFCPRGRARRGKCKYPSSASQNVVSAIT